MAANYEMNKVTKKGWTKQPNAILKDKDLTSDAKVIIYALLSVSGDYHISESGIASTVNLSLERVKKAVKLLKSTGYIEVSKVMNNYRLNGYIWKISDTNGTYRKCDFREVENQATENQATENPSDGISSDRENQRLKIRLTENPSTYEYTERYEQTNDERQKNEWMNGEEERENEEQSLSPFPPINPSDKSVISSGELNTIQAFNRFCEVYPKVGDINTARATFLAIPDIDKICWQIANSVEWFEESGRWDDWNTGQKNVSCPKAVKFLARGDWQEYLKSVDNGANDYANSDMHKFVAMKWQQLETQDHTTDGIGE